MTDHPIIFSAPMVQALLAGRKTMTRRLAWGKPMPGLFESDGGPMRPIMRPSPWQKVQPGDRLYVRESITRSGALVQYMADHKTSHHIWPAKWQRDTAPAMHMPRWASRLTLIVEAVKVEKLQDISERDIAAEGIDHKAFTGHGPAYGQWLLSKWSDLWVSIHGEDSWSANPDVVALTFRVIQENIDRIQPGD